jgi:hypothetical protein
LNEIDNDGNDCSDLLETWRAGDNILLRNAADSTKYGKYTLLATPTRVGFPTGEPTAYYYELKLKVIGGNGSVFTNEYVFMNVTHTPSTSFRAFANLSPYSYSGSGSDPYQPPVIHYITEMEMQPISANAVRLVWQTPVPTTQKVTWYSPSGERYVAEPLPGEPVSATMEHAAVLYGLDDKEYKFYVTCRGDDAVWSYRGNIQI